MNDKIDHTSPVIHDSFDSWCCCKSCNDERDDQQRSEIRAEHIASWVTSGGNPEDANAYAFQEMNGGPADPRTGETCEHGLDQGLCAGPGHYPMDM